MLLLSEVNGKSVSIQQFERTDQLLRDAHRPWSDVASPSPPWMDDTRTLIAMLKLTLLIQAVFILAWTTYGETTMRGPEPAQLAANPDPADWTTCARISDKRFYVDPVIPPDWTWLAVRDAEAFGHTLDWFFYQGIVFAGNTRFRHSTFRTTRFSINLREYVTCEAFHITLLRDREAVALVVGNEDGRPVNYRIESSVFGEPVEFTLDLEPNEPRLLRFFVKQAPFRP